LKNRLIFYKDFIKQGEFKTNKPGLAIKYQDKYLLFYGDLYIHLAVSKDLNNWEKQEEPLLCPRDGFFDYGTFSPLGATVTSNGVLILYDSSSRGRSGETYLRVGAALLKDNKIVWRSDTPVWEEVDNKFSKPIGASFLKDRIIIYYQSAMTSIPYPNIVESEKNIVLEKSLNNPLISPRHNKWEKDGTFNPAAIYLGGKFHILYRAVGESGLSFIGLHTGQLHGSVLTCEQLFLENDKSYFPKYPGSKYLLCIDPCAQLLLSNVMFLM